MHLSAAVHAEDELWQRLTEREDKRRPLEPWSIDVAGRPLVVGGEYELVFDHLHAPVDGESSSDADRLLLDTSIEAEAFYAFASVFAAFVQFRSSLTEELIATGSENTSELEVERGEMWIYGEDLLRNRDGMRLNVDFGRLHFEDERRWWWDEELDAVRIELESDTTDLTVAVARELAPRTFGHGHIEPQHEGVLRVLAEASWNWRRDHTLQVLALHHVDTESSEHNQDSMGTDSDDISDAHLTWLGARLIGAVDTQRRTFPGGVLGYWVDAAGVVGTETVTGHLDNSFSTANREQDVGGWAFDLGIGWLLPGHAEPRVYGGYAMASGEPGSDDGVDRSYRQTGLQTNEAGTGGVQRFNNYGIVLDAELANLSIVTVGVGISLWRSSSLDLLFHRYRLLESATTLRSAGIDLVLDGAHRDLGDGLDLVLAIEEWERLEFELIASAFHGGDALQADQPRWNYEALLAMRIAF
jgi:hypothetical protein